MRSSLLVRKAFESPRRGHLNFRLKLDTTPAASTVGPRGPGGSAVNRRLHIEEKKTPTVPTGILLGGYK